MAHLTLTHRQKIAEGISAGKSNARIARELGVSPSTIGREIVRNADSRETYAADFAQTMAASRQILAARDRFICAAEVYKPSAYRFPFSPYARWSLPSLGDWRDYDPYTYCFSGKSAFYFYPSEQYLVFTRFDKVSGMFRPAGANTLPAALREDSRVRDTFATSETYSETSSASISDHSFSSSGTTDSNKLEERSTLSIERPAHKSVVKCIFMPSLNLRNKNSRPVSAFSHPIDLPAKLQEGRSLLFAA